MSAIQLPAIPRSPITPVTLVCGLGLLFLAVQFKPSGLSISRLDPRGPRTIPTATKNVTMTTTSSSLTPDGALDLLFNPDLIPASVRSELHADLHIRPLARTDYHRAHLHILSVLTSAPDPGLAGYQATFDAQRHCPNTYYTLVIVSRATDQIVAVGCVFIERKFLRNSGKVGHIEDIAVSKDMQGKKLGLRVIQALTGISESMGCYKTILNCSDDNIPFYKKCGYEKKENEMAKYNIAPLVPSSLAPSRASTPKL